MNWIQRKIFLYEVTVGLYGLDWWERFLFRGQVRTCIYFPSTRILHDVTKW
ncbi:hypothetical protein CDL12_25633 [Handroanthus impetiginosus]|uniref:Uncharacterized protein n=1 Tax=Handroanthus impetiginosus TaxID=429701 RepID=A0A2G9G9F2_9LAMI|nr:hypothetical protein CDL12_25633 [Handroanthus impetiginosus]